MNEEIQTALEFAVKAHAGQIRKNTKLPYIVHPVAVMTLIGEWGITCPVMWAAALCHDILEDCPHISLNDLQNAIGVSATKIVQELTFLHDPAKPKKPQKILYMKSFDKKSLEAVVLKVADRLKNTHDFLLESPDYAYKYFKEAEDVISQLVSRRSEIEEKYGLDAYILMRYSITTIVGMLTKK